MDWPTCSGARWKWPPEALETLSPEAWNTIRLSLAEMLLTLARQKSPGVLPKRRHRHPAGAAATPLRCDRTQARRSRDHAGAHRADRRHLGAYLQKLFEATGDNFTHYLRERRLQRCWADLANPAQAHRSVSDIAFGCGFSDAAHFSRSFRDRFGLSPKTRSGSRRPNASPVLGIKAGQRGWPQDAIAQLRPHRAAPMIAPAEPEPVELTPRNRTGRRIIICRSMPNHVHWGFFSRALKPLIEIASGRHHHRRDAVAARLRRSLNA